MTAKSTKYTRATAALKEAPLTTLRDTLCAVVDVEKKRIRFSHPEFTLEFRLNKEGTAPEVVAPYSVTQAERDAVTQAFGDAVLAASDDEVTLLDLLHHVEQKICGQDVLRCLLPMRVMRGSKLTNEARSTQDSSHLRLVV